MTCVLLSMNIDETSLISIHLLLLSSILHRLCACLGITLHREIWTMRTTGMAVRSGITLLSLLESHELPESLKYDKETSGKSSAKSTSVSSRAVEVTPECVLREDDHLLNRVHHTLERLSTFISSSHTFPPGSLLPDSSQLVEIDREFKTVTSRARREATREKMSAETGESHFLKAHLVNPLNLLLEVLFPHLRVYWRFVGWDPEGNPISNWLSRRKERW